MEHQPRPLGPPVTVRVGYTTCAAEPDLDEEGRLLVAALAERGVAASAVVWSDAAVDWAGFDLVLVRATWDYTDRVAEFLAWARHVDDVGRLLNPPGLLGFSTDKAYLRDLADAGVPIVPSTFLAPGDGADHPLLDVEHVVKPSVSAGSRDALRLRPDESDRSREHVRRLHDSGRTALVQPYLADVDVRGETAVVWLDGAVSHALRKGALLRPGAGRVEGLYAVETIDPVQATAAEIAVAEAALAAVPAAARAGEEPLYARVDLLGTDAGPVVLELELAEPSLFLHRSPGSAERFAEAICRRLAQRDT